MRRLWDSFLALKITHAVAASLQSCPTLYDPIDGSPPASFSLGFSRQEYWNGLPFPSPMHVRWVQLCGSLSILWHCLSLGLEWRLPFSSPVATLSFPNLQAASYQMDHFWALNRCYRRYWIRSYWMRSIFIEIGLFLPKLSYFYGLL